MSGKHIQSKFNQALDNYLSLANVLTEDLVELRESENESGSWRRNFIRVVAATIEGYSHCFREMVKIGLDLDMSNFSKKEVDAMKSGFGLSTSERIKLTLKVTYRMYEVFDPPDFGGLEWQNAIQVFDKRHSLMHPKNKEDLDVGDETWGELWEGSTWLVEQHFKFVNKLYEMHVLHGR